MTLSYVTMTNLRSTVALVDSFKTLRVLHGDPKHLFQLVVAGVRWKVDSVETVVCAWSYGSCESLNGMLRIVENSMNEHVFWTLFTFRIPPEQNSNLGA